MKFWMQSKLNFFFNLQVGPSLLTCTRLSRIIESAIIEPIVIKIIKFLPWKADDILTFIKGGFFPD